MTTCSPSAGASASSIRRPCRSTAASAARLPDIYVVSNVLDAQGDPIGALGAGEAVWHTDMSYLATPPDASMLYALEIPPTGGDTWFCGMQAACAIAARRCNAQHRGRRIKHDGTYNSAAAICVRA